MIRKYSVSLLSFGLALLSAAAMDASHAAHASAVISSRPMLDAVQTPAVKSGSEPISTMVILCPTSDGKFLESRANLLRLTPVLSTTSQGRKKPKLSFAITSAHGLVDKQGEVLSGCTLRSTSAKSYAVYDIRLAKDYVEGMPTDWAVLALEPVNDTRLIHYVLPERLSVSQYNALAAQALPVTFPKGRGILHSEQKCTLLEREIAGFEGAQYEGFLSHNCRSTSGQSGSPIAVTRSGVDVLLGVHIGNSLALKTPTLRPPRYYGYFRVLDQDSVAQIMSMTSDMQMTVTPKTAK